MQRLPTVTAGWPWWFLLALPLAGCNLRDAAVPMVRVEANKDLKCPDKEIEVESLMGGRYRASGCNRRAIYTSVCDGLQCSVAREGENATTWRDRPTPGEAEFDR